MEGSTYLTSRGSIICNFEMPLSWHFQKDSVTIVYGTATCTCNSSPAHTDADIEKRAKEITAHFSNKTAIFSIRFIKRKLVKLGEMELKKD
jgi:hypothetical protein